MKKTYKKRVMCMFTKKRRVIHLYILSPIFTSNKSQNFISSTSFKKNITTIHKLKPLKDSNQNLQISQWIKLFKMAVLRLQDNFTTIIYCKFRSGSLETFLESKLSTHSHFSNCFQSFSGKLCPNFRMLDSNVTYCIIILVMLLGSSYAISVQRIKTLIGYRSMTLAPHEVYVLENNKWIGKSSYELRPGDIISVTAGYQHKKVPHESISDKEYLSKLIPFANLVPQKLMQQASPKK